MPLFEFQCPKCKVLVERLQRYDDDPPCCMACHATMNRKISRTSFILKGHGWFKDSYSSEAP
jgi:putative FmdB family regulatory protein